MTYYIMVFDNLNDKYRFEDHFFLLVRVLIMILMQYCYEKSQFDSLVIILRKICSSIGNIFKFSTTEKNIAIRALTNEINSIPRSVLYSVERWMKGDILQWK